MALHDTKTTFEYRLAVIKSQCGSGKLKELAFVVGMPCVPSSVAVLF